MATNAETRVAVFVEATLWGGLEMHTVDLVTALNAAQRPAVAACIGEGTASLFRRNAKCELPIIEVARPSTPSWLGWRKALAAVRAEAAIYQKGTLNAGHVTLDWALRHTFNRFITVEHLEPPEIPARTRRLHFGVVPGVGLWWYRWKLRGYARSMAPQRIVCVSDSVRRALAVDYHFPVRKLVTVRNGVDVTRFHPDPVVRAQVRELWGVALDAHVFGSVRRFVWEKGLDVAIRAFAQLARNGVDQNTVLVLIGDGPEKGALRELARSLGLENRVLMPGFTNEPWKVYPAFDTFIIPSRIEALGVVVAEAMASGCFVIGSRVGGIPEIIPSQDVGLLVPPDNPNALAAAMALARESRAGESASAARRHVLEHYNAATQYNRIGAVLEADGH